MGRVKRGSRGAESRADRVTTASNSGHSEAFRARRVPADWRRCFFSVQDVTNTLEGLHTGHAFRVQGIEEHPSKYIGPLDFSESPTEAEEDDEKIPAKGTGRRKWRTTSSKSTFPKGCPGTSAECANLAEVQTQQKSRGDGEENHTQR
ncbi:hypothetical protein EYF80_005541 [Liparis tanakae]|uniref:Uncharacterized protein n=1 Tax=Liparis tanakae TaxID=230148 RepID=A0A4Z2J2Y7_9TELE|nr:hypothetical protein EYF80_005541 [Liparis tanakae]